MPGIEKHERERERERAYKHRQTHTVPTSNKILTVRPKVNTNLFQSIVNLWRRRG